MTYLPPSVLLERLSEFTSDTLMSAIGEGSKFERAQVGSMSSTLAYLSKEVAGRDSSIREQREALLNALDELEPLGDEEATAFVADQREPLESVDPTIGNSEAVQSALLVGMTDLHEAIDDGTFKEDTPEARRVLYDLFGTRVESQLQVLGRES